MAVEVGKPVTPSSFDGVVPQLIAQTAVVASGTAFNTTENSQAQVTGTLVAGTLYEIRVFTNISSTVANQGYLLKIREGSGTGGTQLQQAQITPGNTSTVGEGISFWAQYTPGSDGSQTFTFSAIRNGGASGDGQLRAGSDRPTYVQIWSVP